MISKSILSLLMGLFIVSIAKPAHGALGEQFGVASPCQLPLLKTFEISRRTDLKISLGDLLLNQAMRPNLSIAPKYVDSVVVYSNGTVEFNFDQGFQVGSKSRLHSLQTHIGILLRELPQTIINSQAYFNSLHSLLERIKNQQSVTLQNIVDVTGLADAEAYGITEADYWTLGPALTGSANEAIRMKLAHLAAHQREIVSTTNQLLQHLEYNRALITNINHNVRLIRASQKPTKPVQPQVE